MEDLGFPFDAVIFDMDGVIVDTEIKYMQDEVVFFAEYGIDMKVEDLYGMAGASHQDFCDFVVSKLGTVGVELTPDGAWELYGEWEKGRPWNYTELLNPGIAETLAALRERGVRIALASSSPMEKIDQVLDECGIGEYFEIRVSGNDFAESKPNPEIYLHTLERLGLPAEACCCVEDSLPGIAAGKAAGLTVFAKREERFGFSQDHADRIIDSVPDLLSAAHELRP